MKPRNGSKLDSAWWGFGPLAALVCLALATTISSDAPPWLEWLFVGAGATAGLICAPALLYQMRGSFLHGDALPPTPATECHACGYNLTGNTSGYCPECGARVLTSRKCGADVSGEILKRRGDRIGLGISALCCVGGFLLMRYGPDDAIILGALVIWVSIGIGLMCVAQMLRFWWMRKRG